MHVFLCVLGHKCVRVMCEFAFANLQTTPNSPVQHRIEYCVVHLEDSLAELHVQLSTVAPRLFLKKVT